MTTTVKLKSKYWPSSWCSKYHKRVCCPWHIQMSIRFVDSPNICHMTTHKRVFSARWSFSCIVAGRRTGQFNNRIHHHNALNIYIQPNICWDALLWHSSSGEYFCSTYPQTRQTRALSQDDDTKTQTMHGQQCPASPPKVYIVKCNSIQQESI